tara:strand:+ start:310 stop:426 length:117 start_codon:yes stop_codon:yes gene_type:complete
MRGEKKKEEPLCPGFLIIAARSFCARVGSDTIDTSFVF